MGEVISNLKARFTVENTDFRKGLSDNQRALNDLDRKVWKTVDAFKGMFTPLAILAGAGGALALLKKSIGEVEGPADRFEAVIGGGKEALFEFQRAIGSMDFTNFFQNLSEGFERGKQFTEALDELADRAAYNDYKIAELNRNSEALQEIVKDKTKELSVRADAARKVKEIEADIVKRKVELAREEFEIAKAQWEGRNKMEAEEAVKLYETIDNLSDDIKKKLETAFDWQIGLFGSKKGIQGVVSGATAGMLRGVPQEVIESYGEYLSLIERGEKDVLIKLFNTFKNIDEKGYQAQREYNSIVAQTTRLLASENIQLAKKQENLEKISDESLEPYQAPTGNLNMPDFGYHIEGYNELKESLIQVKAELTKEEEEIYNVLMTGAENTLVGFGEWIGSFMVGEKKFRDIGELIGYAFGDLLIMMGRVAIKIGISILALKNAIATLSGWGAIAVGVGMVAFGTALKLGTQGIYDQLRNEETEQEKDPIYIYDTRPGASQGNVIKLTGDLRLVASGRDLVAVLNEEAIRKLIST